MSLDDMLQRLQWNLLMLCNSVMCILVPHASCSLYVLGCRS